MFKEEFSFLVFFFWPTHDVWFVNHCLFSERIFWRKNSLPSMNTENRIKAIRSCFENWTIGCILCPMNTVSLSFFRSSQQFQCSRQSASAEPQCGFYKKWTCRLFIMFLIWKSWVSQWRDFFYFNANVTRQSQNRSICRLWSSYDLIAVQVIFFYMEKDLCFQRVWP